MLFIDILLVLSLLAVGMLWRRWRARKQRTRQIEQLRRWAADHEALEPALNKWIQNLPATQAQVLWELLDGYCTSLNWELSWLFAPQIEKAPELKTVLEESVHNYARAILHSLQMEVDVVAYQTYVAFDKKPTARKHRPLVEQLYQKVNEERLTPPTNRIFGWFAPKGPTRKTQITTIQQAFERNPTQAMAALREILVADAAVTVAHVRQELAQPVRLAAAGTAA